MARNSVTPKGQWLLVAIWAVSGICVAMPREGTNGHTSNNTSTYNRMDSRAVQSLPYTLRISAFNIKTFGVAKMSDPTRAKIIRDIVLRYDIILIQEIRDATGTALQQLWDLVGRMDSVYLMDAHQFDDGPDDYTDVFEREPFSVRFKPIGGSWDFGIIGIHAKPADAVAEIDALLDVYDDAMAKWSDIQDMILIGDFNADCSYASESDLIPLTIYTQSMFLWPIDFSADTTTSTNTDCAYDRIVLAGKNVRAAYIPGSEGIYQFENHHKLSYSEMLDISDHYPVELELYIA